MRKAQLCVEGLSAFRVADKLSRAGILVLSLKKSEKNAVLLEVASKDLQKAFAILRGSCYNVTRVRYRGAEKALRFAVRRIGLLAGICLFLVCVFFLEGRVMRVQVAGSGSYYERDVLSILEESGISSLCAAPADTAQMREKILALPGVSFCSLHFDGGILTVNVEVARDEAPIKGRPLCAPVSGTLVELIVVRGLAAVQVGDLVEAGQTLVAGEGVVIAAAKIEFPFEKEYEGSEEAARAQAMLEAGTLKEITAEKTERGYLVRGRAEATENVNLP